MKIMLVIITSLLAGMYFIPEYLAFAFKWLSLTFVFFAYMMALKYKIMRNGREKSKFWRAVYYVTGGRFLYRDVIANLIITVPMLQLPRHYGEGWLLTDRVNAIQDYVEDLRAPSTLDLWRYEMAQWICSHLNNVERAIGGKAHCK